MLFAELFYTRQQCSLRSLAIMCQGLLDDAGGPLVNTSVQPWNQVKPNKLKLTAKELRDEVTRRHSASENVLGIPPRPNAWTVARAQEWLNDNPITIAGEVAFLKAAIRQHVDTGGAEGVPGAGAAGARANWHGKYPHLRLIHAMVDHDNIKRAYITRGHLPSGRMTVENRNTQATKDKSVWKLLADKWNDPLYFPVTSVKENTHSDFSRPIALSFEIVSHMQPATVEKVQEKWSSMVLALNRVIQKWERSGQGYGGQVEEEEKENDEDDGDEFESAQENECASADGGEQPFGQLANRSQGALDQRQNFIDGKSSYLLYLWDMLEEHNLFQSSMQRLNEGIGCGSGNNVPTIIADGKRKRDDDDDEALSLSSSLKSEKGSNSFMNKLDSIFQKHGDSLITVAHIEAEERRAAAQRAEANVRAAAERAAIEQQAAAIRQRINNLKDKHYDIVLRSVSTEVMNSQLASDTLKGLIARIENDIADQERQLSQLHVTPVRSNISPRSRGSSF